MQTCAKHFNGRNTAAEPNKCRYAIVSKSPGHSPHQWSFQCSVYRELSRLVRERLFGRYTVLLCSIWRSSQSCTTSPAEYVDQKALSFLAGDQHFLIPSTRAAMRASNIYKHSIITTRKPGYCFPMRPSSRISPLKTDQTSSRKRGTFQDTAMGSFVKITTQAKTTSSQL